MSEAKIKVQIGSLLFVGQGEAAWLDKQLDKILESASTLADLASTQMPDNAQDTGNSGKEFKTTLATYIKTKGGDSNQVKRFLAAADWLRRRGKSDLTTAAVSKALKDNQQKKLSNPSDCLNQNVAKGYCEKTGKSFFITPEGLQALGD